MPPLCCSHPPGQAWCPKLAARLAFPLLKAAIKQSRVHLLDTRMGKTYNIPEAEVAQVVEQRTENPRVSGSTPLLGTADVKKRLDCPKEHQLQSASVELK